jgi:hypothetical protein
MRSLEVLTFVLALAVAVQPPPAYACNMEQNQHQHGDHSTMQMDHGADASADCCDPKNADTRDDCARTIRCGTCLGSPLIVALLPPAAPVIMHAPTFDIGAGKLLPGHTSPPYHPPIS